MGNGYYDRKMSKPCACCMNTFKWIPVIFIAAVIGWSYYAYVVQLCIFAVDSVIQKILFIFFYHIILILFLWSYWATIFTPVGTVPPNFRIPDSEIERIFRAESQESQKRLLSNFARNLPVTNRTLNGSVRLCEKCKIVKPDRAHHCSVCGTCVLKMDHHCPWVNNCVNFLNYKFFVLFLGYALLYCLYVAFTSLDNFIQFWQTLIRNALNFLTYEPNDTYSEQGELNDSGMGRFHILFLFFVALMFAISLVSLFGYHIYLVLTNRTTLEAFRAPIFRVGGPDKNGYNLGRLANFQEVFGDDWQFWFLPIFTSRGDGVDYPVSAHQRTNLANYETMGETQTRLEHGNPTDKLIDINDATLNNHHQQQQHMLLHEHVHLEQHHHQHQDQQQQPQKTLQQRIQDPSQDDGIAASRNDTAKLTKSSSAQEPIVVINIDEHCGGDNEAAAAAGKAITTIPIDINGSSSNVQHHL